MADDKLPKDTLKETLSRLFRPLQKEAQLPTTMEELQAGLDLSPRSPFDVVLDQRLKALESQVEELKGRVNGLMALVAGAVVVQIVLGFFRT
ncbi:MAG: hypothetical protein HYU30_03125 [Chloroflexi bacterium]|nr:hypothetical protein [Chloroflexota bacterium]MBI4197633.1 hypothetical protein [Chloroflexota bacterium]